MPNSMRILIKISLFALLPSLAWAGSTEIPPDCMIRIPFAPPVDIATGTVGGVSAIDVRDINLDGQLDVAVIEGGKHAKMKTFAWFQAPDATGEAWIRHEFNPEAPLKSFLGSARLADMDNDGDIDLVVSADHHSGPVREADVLVFLNPLPNNPPSGPWDYVWVARDLPYNHINDMEVADLDRDGKTDIVVRSLEPNEIHAFFQNSVDSWTKLSIPTELEQSEGLAVGCLNDDPYPEISFTGYILQALGNPRQNGYERLTVDGTYHTVNQNTKEALGDIDGDGWMDLILAPAEAYRKGKPYDLSWYRNPAGDLAEAWVRHVILANTNNTHTVKLADMNMDGRLDVVTGVAWGDLSVKIYYNLGDGSFSDPQVVSNQNGLYTGMAVDFDRDGDTDIIGQQTYAKDSQPLLYRSLLVN